MMTGKKGIISLVALLAAWLFVSFFVVIVPSDSVVRIDTWDKKVFEESPGKASVLLRFHTGAHKYEAGKRFSLQGYFFAPKRGEKILKNNFSFLVLFPYKNIEAKDTAFLFGLIQAHAFLAMEKASGMVNNDFYLIIKESIHSYPQLFEGFLCQPADKRLSELYFTGARINKIIYDDGPSEENVKKFFDGCREFIKKGNGKNVNRKNI